MHPTLQRSPVHRSPVGSIGRIAAMGLLVVAVAACGVGKSPADQAQDELNAGLTADAAGNAADAATHYKACLALETMNKYWVFNLGVRAQNAGRALEAEYDYRLALLQDPDFSSALYNLAILRVAAGSTQEGSSCTST